MSISGDVIQTWPASGRNAVYVANQSGTLAVHVTNNNADGLSVGGGSMYVHSLVEGIDEIATTKINRVKTTASGSVLSAGGTNFKLLTAVSGDVMHISGQTVATSVSGNYVNTSVSGNVLSIHQEAVEDPVVITANLSLVSGLNFLPNISFTSGVQFRTVFPGQNPSFFVGGSTSGNHPSIGNGNNSVGIPLPTFMSITNLNQIAIAVLADTSPVELNYFAITISG